MKQLEPFARQQYLNLETYRRSGVGVKTPVWFTPDGDTLFGAASSLQGRKYTVLELKVSE